MHYYKFALCLKLMPVEMVAIVDDWSFNQISLKYVLGVSHWLHVIINDHLMAWYHQATRYYLNQSSQTSVTPYRINSPQWVDKQRVIMGTVNHEKWYLLPPVSWQGYVYLSIHMQWLKHSPMVNPAIWELIPYIQLFGVYTGGSW